MVCTGCLQAVAQLSNIRQKKIAASGIISLDSNSIVPGSLFIPEADTNSYVIDYPKAVLTWLKALTTDSVIIQYRSFPFRLGVTKQRFRFDSIQNNFIPAQPQQAKRQNADEGLFNFGKLNYNGSLGRSISVGNNQDAVFNSQLNMQLSGYIGDSILLAAAITDNNIPIQPDGNTQQLNEFDQVLLQFKKDKWSLELGDIDLRQNTSSFLNFYKRLQGAAWQQQLISTEKINSRLLASGAIAKGRFARNIFQGLEGNQGPYRLTGANNEFFFVVLANTEKIFIDGVQMQRGEDQDYVINYNTAEITFTPRQMITKDKRIQVEFEYADRNYLNTLVFASAQTDIGSKLSFGISVFNQADARNSPINQTLDNAQKQFLSGIGDSIQNAFYPSALLDTFDVNKILYRQADTVYHDITETIYIYSNNPDSALYQLSFIETGPNKGNYIPLFNAANGKVYQWIQPLDGVPQGNFEPAIFLVTPKQLRIVNGTVTWRMDSSTTLQSDLAYSTNNINRFSSADQKNDNGLAAKIAIQHNRLVSVFQKQNNLQLMAGYEFVDERFRTIERLRTVEFYRDWGLSFLPNFTDEKIPSAEIKISDSNLHSFRYKYTAYTRGDGYRGRRNELQHDMNFKGWQLQTLLQQTNFKTNIENGFFWRPAITTSRTFTHLQNISAGAQYLMEYSASRNNNSDTITPASFGFDVLTAWIKTDAQKPNKLSFTWFSRSDLLPIGKDLLRTDRSQNYTVQAELLSNPAHQWRISSTYRELRLLTTSPVSGLVPEKTLLGRTEYAVREWNGFLTGQALYETGSGQEQRRDFSYVEVPAGTGQFAWNDYNQDGIQQLNEFETALFSDQAKFIRIFTPTNQFIRANYTQFNYAFSLNPAVWYKPSANKKRSFITRLQLQSALQRFIKKASASEVALNPFKGGINDTSLINLRYVVNNTLSYNRSSSVWGIDLTQVLNYNKALLTYGFETLQQNTYTLKSRVNFARAYTVELTQRLGRLQLTTPNFENRNYDLKIFDINPKFSYINGTVFRISGNYLRQEKKNQKIYGGETALSNSFTAELRYNARNNTALNTGFTWNNIRYSGETNSAVSYIMLEGLLPGNNYLWNLGFTRRLLNNLELSIEYEGRKPGETRVIHTGRASVRALL